MKSLLNINKSAFRPGEYVGYAPGLVFRIRREGSSAWIAYARGGAARGTLTLRAPTLALLSVALENVIA